MWESLNNLIEKSGKNGAPMVIIFIMFSMVLWTGYNREQALQKIVEEQSTQLAEISVTLEVIADKLSAFEGAILQEGLSNSSNDVSGTSAGGLIRDVHKSMIQYKKDKIYSTWGRKK